MYQSSTTKICDLCNETIEGIGLGNSRIDSEKKAIDSLIFEFKKHVKTRKHKLYEFEYIRYNEEIVGYING